MELVTVFLSHTKQSKQWCAEDFVRDSLWDYLRRERKMYSFYDRVHLPGGDIARCIEASKLVTVLIVVLDDVAPSKWMAMEIEAAAGNKVAIQTIYRKDKFTWAQVGKDAWWAKRGTSPYRAYLTPELIQTTFTRPAIEFDCTAVFLETSRANLVRVLCELGV